MFLHLNGMFAIAIWDARRRQLVLGRDRWARNRWSIGSEPDRLLFASELKSLLQVPGLAREIDATALDQYLTYQYVPHPRTIFRGFRKLPPGHYAVYRERPVEGAAVLGPGFNQTWQGTEAEAFEQLRRPWSRRSSCGCRATCRWALFSPAASIRR